MATRKKKQGLFLSFEGGEGCGKTTQIRRLTRRLQKAKIPFLLTREPGGSNLGRKIRKLLLDPQHGPVDPRAELLLYEADRAQHMTQIIQPALKKGSWVVSDRHGDSSTVYQGMVRGLGVKTVESFNAWATEGRRPDRVILIDVPAQVGLGRVKKRGTRDRIEKEKLRFHEGVRKGFLKLARREPRRFIIIDGCQSPEEIEKQIWKFLERLAR